MTGEREYSHRPEPDGPGVEGVREALDRGPQTAERRAALDGSELSYRTAALQRSDCLCSTWPVSFSRFRRGCRRTQLTQTASLQRPPAHIAQHETWVIMAEPKQAPPHPISTYN